MQPYFDCLTDGSEHTGGPAIFLTLRKSNADGPILARYNLSGLPSLTGRLASDQSYQLLSGGCFRCILLPSMDNVGGFAALFLSLVQYGYKVLNPTVVAEDGSDSESSIENDKDSSIAYGDVSIIGPQRTSTLVDGILDVLFGNTRRRPAMRVCEVPSNQEGCWWDVYQDVYVRIWAQSVGRDKGKKRKRPDSSAACSTELSVVYIIMIKSSQRSKGRDVCKSDPISFAVLPHKREHECNNDSLIWNTLRHLPQEVIDAAGEEQGHHLDFILHLEPASRAMPCVAACSMVNAEQTNVDAESYKVMGTAKRMIHVPEWVIQSKLSRSHISTFPYLNDKLDQGTLIRAQQRSMLLNKYLPFAFPMREQKEDACILTNETEGNVSSNIGSFQLSSCSSLQINGSRHASCNQHFMFISRLQQILDKSNAGKDECEIEHFLDHQVVSLLRCAYNSGDETVKTKMTLAAADDNEIDLENSSESDNDSAYKNTTKHPDTSEYNYTGLDPTSPHLLLLGTGCATPSPLRGSSSYALFMPTANRSEPQLVLSAIVECGEGTLTSLSRYLPSTSLEEQLKWVQFIWISHSHLDHYGDVPYVVQAISLAKNATQPLIVVAPSKVLKFLSVALGSQSSNAKHHSYIGVTHREFQSSPFASGIRSMILDYALPTPFLCMTEHTVSSTGLYRPFASLRNVEVEHCREAYALILELRVPLKDHNQQPFVLCFSGDTRPSNNLLQACRSRAPVQLDSWHQKSVPPPPPPRISLLLHEATFLHDEHGKTDAVKKRHSTTMEALDIAKNMQADACLLTHFSQRYAHVSISDAYGGDLNEGAPTCSSNDTRHAFPWGIGADGMIIPLTKEATELLHHLSQCVDAMLSK